jgi:hypothetical protein
VHAAALPDSVDKQQHLHTAALVTEPKTQASRKSISPNCLLFDFILRLSTWPASSLRLPTQGSGKHGISTDDARSLSHRLATASITQHPPPLLHLHVLELVQLLVTLMAFGFATGNTMAAFEARALVIDYASEEVTRMIVKSALVRNAWLLGSAVCILACVNMLDSWSLPESMEDLTDPLFRLTRTLIGACTCIDRSLCSLTIS